MHRIFAGLCALLFAAAATAAQPGSMRVDFVHSGNALNEMYSLDRVLLEPLPWPGNLDQAIDTLRRGDYFFDVVEPGTGKVLYSRGFSSIFGEWRTTEEARTLNRAFAESLRFPAPAAPVRVRVYARDDARQFSMVWTLDVDPGAADVVRKHRPIETAPVAIHQSGPPEQKVDLLMLGDGYTEAERPKFLADARRMSAALFKVSPYRERASDFNVWALMVAAPESGVSRPSTGTYRWTPLGARYDAFGSERYVLSFDNANFRDVAQHAPYEFVELLVNNETYGGGGIYGLYATAAAGSEWADYLFVHEFGHHFAALADEYFTSDVSYAAAVERREPWEPNITALHDPAKLKWAHLVEPGTALPTPWPKAEYEQYQRDNQARRRQLREERRPEAEMNALFHSEQEHVEAMFSAVPARAQVGAFEGALYESTGYYRPQLDCLMFTRTDHFCRVCDAAIGAVIDLYSTPAVKPD
jgi:hypothetical protein